MRNHDQVISEQFGSTAAAYLTSAVHAQGADLQDLAAYAQQYAQPVILDMGCGGGHASFAVAPHARQVSAYDLSAEMLDVVRQAAAERKLDNIETRQGSADSFPLPMRCSTWCARGSARITGAICRKRWRKRRGC